MRRPVLFGGILVALFLHVSQQQNPADYQQQQAYLTPDQQQQVLQLQYAIAGLTSQQRQPQAQHLSPDQRQFLDFLQRHLFGAQQQQQIQQQQRADLIQSQQQQLQQGYGSGLPYSDGPGISISTILHDPSASANLRAPNLRDLPYQEVESLVAPLRRPQIPPGSGQGFGELSRTPGGFLSAPNPGVDPRFDPIGGSLPYGYGGPPFRNSAKSFRSRACWQISLLIFSTVILLASKSLL